MRPIPPTLKDTPRYAFIPGATRHDYEHLCVRYAELFGTIGLASARLVLVESRDGLVIRVENSELDRLRVATASLGGLGIARVSGTLEKLRTNYLNRSSSRRPNEREGE
jgi:RNase P/RNase MRP subunit POP5